MKELEASTMNLFKEIQNSSEVKRAALLALSMPVDAVSLSQPHMQRIQGDCNTTTTNTFADSTLDSTTDVSVTSDVVQQGTTEVVTVKITLPDGTPIYDSQSSNFNTTADAGSLGDGGDNGGGDSGSGDTGKYFGSDGSGDSGFGGGDGGGDGDS